MLMPEIHGFEVMVELNRSFSHVKVTPYPVA